MQVLADTALIASQNEKYSRAVHTNDDITVEAIRNIRVAAEALQPSRKYKEYSEVRFIWEMLELEEKASQIRDIVDTWVQVGHRANPMSTRANKREEQRGKSGEACRS